MSLPSLAVILRYWAAEFLGDPGEPACMACHRPGNLQRAHLKPRANGGSDRADNVVALCPPCHKAAPDWPDPAAALAWMHRRRHYLDAFIDDVRVELELLNPSALAELEARTDLDEQLGAELRAGRAGTHGVRLAPATVALALERVTRRPGPPNVG